jgi:putative membrane protein
MAQETGTTPVPDQLTLALERTFLAYERTLMAWTRTATSLIAFGFTLYKFFEYLHESGQVVRGPQVLGARVFGLIMIGVGVFTLVVASIQHRTQMLRLRAHYRQAPHSLAFILAGLIACLGVIGLISALIWE